MPNQPVGVCRWSQRPTWLLASLRLSCGPSPPGPQSQEETDTALALTRGPVCYRSRGEAAAGSAAGGECAEGEGRSVQPAGGGAEVCATPALVLGGIGPLQACPSSAKWGDDPYPCRLEKSTPHGAKHTGVTTFLRCTPSFLPEVGRGFGAPAFLACGVHPEGNTRGGGPLSCQLHLQSTLLGWVPCMELPTWLFQKTEAPRSSYRRPLEIPCFWMSVSPC